MKTTFTFTTAFLSSFLLLFTLLGSNSFALNNPHTSSSKFSLATRSKRHGIFSTAPGEDNDILTRRLSDGGSPLVQWDPTSLFIKGKRTFIWSGEFHGFRLPSPHLSLDILQKFKATGLNTVSTYVHWGSVNPSEGEVEWGEGGYRDFDLWLKQAEAAGLYVIARPGPYINGESSGGGIPGRVTNIDGFLRSGDPDYTQSYQDYYRSVVKIIKRHQISDDPKSKGSVILVQVENEYTNNTNFATDHFVDKNRYMQNLIDILKELGIVVPLTSNDSYQGKNFAPGSGNDSVGDVEIYALDSYPQGSCATPLLWSNGGSSPPDYWPYHEDTNPQNPWYTPEFQGGSYLGYGPNSPSYEQCNTLTGADFEQVFYLNLLATGFKLNNIYMAFGGTSWGAFPFPGVYTSYDYGAMLAENRTMTSKFFELKNIGLFIRSCPDLAGTEIVANTTLENYTSNLSIFVTEIRNPDTNSGFYIARNKNSSSFEKKETKININTTLGLVAIPQSENLMVTINGRQSRTIITDHEFGQHSYVLYSTASLLYSGTIGTRDVLLLHGPAGQSFEAVIDAGPLEFTGEVSDLRVDAVEKTKNFTLVTFSPQKGQISTSVTDQAIVIVCDTHSTETLYSPVIPNKDGSTHFHVDTNETILVWGPDLVRNATIDGNTVSLFGDLSKKTDIAILAPESVDEVVWNSNLINGVTKNPGILSLSIDPSIPKLTLPELKKWKYADSLPEIKPQYDDSHWLDVNLTNSSNPFPKYYGDQLLYACTYGFCEGPVLWRGYFLSGDGRESGVNLSISGGRAFAGSVWLNGAFLGSTFGNSSNNQNLVETTNETYKFPEGILSTTAGNVITVLHDNMGMEEAQANQYPEWIKSPRGIQGYYVHGAKKQPTWKVQGKLGGYENFPDRVRGIMNEGGLYGERAGFHLPGFPDASWETTTSLNVSSAGVGFFRHTFDLNIPEGLDVGISFNFPEWGHGSHRAWLYVNGWNMGRYLANFGPQNKFSVPEGILNYRGTNTIAIALWATEANGASISELTIEADWIKAGGVGPAIVESPEWADRGLV